MENDHPILGSELIKNGVSPNTKAMSQSDGIISPKSEKSLHPAGYTHTHTHAHTSIRNGVHSEMYHAYDIFTEAYDMVKTSFRTLTSHAV